MFMYFVVRVFFDQNNIQSNSIQKYTDLIAAKKRFYTLLASDIDNGNYLYELVQIIDERGTCLASQVFDNRPVIPDE